MPDFDDLLTVCGSLLIAAVIFYAAYFTDFPTVLILVFSLLTLTWIKLFTIIWRFEDRGVPQLVSDFLHGYTVTASLCEVYRTLEEREGE